MKLILAVAVAVFYAFVAAEEEMAMVTPVQKVLQLLEGMAAKGKEEKHAEGVQFAAYKQFCDDTEQDKSRAIAKAEEDLSILKAEIAKATSDAEALADEVAQHDKDIRDWSERIEKEGVIRVDQHAAFAELHKDYSESLSALTRAIEVMERAAETGDVAQSPALLAVKNLRLVPHEAKHVLGSFLARDMDLAAQDPVSAPEVNAYDFQSHSATEMMKQLFDKFTEERTKIETEEATRKHTYELLIEDLEREIKEARTMRQDKLKRKTQRLQVKAEKESDFSKIAADKAANEEYLSEVKATCAKKASDFEKRKVLRTEEIATIEEAIKTISDEKTLQQGRYNTFFQLQRTQAPAHALAHLRGDETSEVKNRLAQYLQSRATELNSQVLSLLATRAYQDPFGKVKKMIKELLDRLVQQAAEEADHKAWCDKEMETNKATRTEKTALIETLQSEIEELDAIIIELGEQIAAIAKELEELQAAMTKATELRTTEKAKNKETVQDSILAQNAVASALSVLKEFYKEAMKAEVFAQQEVRQAPAIFDDAYKGMQAEKGGVLGLLEVIASDFARLESETKTAEKSASDEYNSFMSESSINQEQMLRSRRRAEVTKLDKEQSREERSQDLAGTQKELTAALDYFENLKPTCIDQGIKYEDRVAARDAELESLRNAYSILNGETI